MAENLRVQREQEENRRWINGLVSSAQQRDWYGSIQIDFKKGRIDMVRCEETLKPPTSKKG